MKKLLTIALAVLLMVPMASMFFAQAETTEYSFPWTGDEVTLDYYYVDFRYAGRTYDSLIDEEFQKAIGNVKINDMSVGWGDYGTKWNLMFSSGELPDIIFGGKGNASTYASSGILLDFAPYLDLMPNYSALYAKYPSVFNYVGDSIYGICQVRDVKINSKVWYVNQYYLDKGNYGIPQTMDEMLTILRAVKADYPEIYPLLRGWDGLSVQTQMQFDTRNGIFFNFLTDKWEYGPTNAGYKEYIEYMATLYKEGLIAPDYDTQADDLFQTRFNDPHAWYIYSGYNEMNDALVAKMQETEPGYSPTFFLPPVAEGHDRKIWTEAFIGAPIDSVFCAADTKDPAFLCAFLDYLLSDGIGTLVNWGIEGTTFEYNADGVKQYLPTLKLDSNPTQGTILPTQDLGLTPHFMIKQLGLATKNDFNAMNTFYASPTAMARENQSTAYIEEHPDSEVYGMPLPDFTADEKDQIAMLLTDLQTYVDENSQLFIYGKRDLSEWDAFIQELNSLGDIQGLIDLYNSKPMPVYVNE